LESRYRTRQIDDFGGLSARLPIFALLMFFFCMASAGLPGLAGFVGEFLALAGMYARSWPLAAVGALGIIFGAWYLLTLLQKLFFGALKEPPDAPEPGVDLKAPEIAALALPAILVVVLGLHPGPLLERMRGDVAGLASIYEQPSRLEPPTPKTTALALRQEKN
ncbi:MAG TPA: proton-conducting transporter membrane subunit, partial [Planctomycetia bacterium]|nr:proton-conducting transporter membrane subunit [Planctomycetia bacterium]